MTANAVVQTRIDADLKERATVVLDEWGITISDAIRLLLTRTAEDGMLPFPMEAAANHDAWFRAKVNESLEDPRPVLSNEDVEKRFAERREILLRHGA